MVELGEGILVVGVLVDVVVVNVVAVVFLWLGIQVNLGLSDHII